MLDDKDFFRETIIEPEESTESDVEIEITVDEETEIGETESDTQECSSLIFSRDIDYRNPFMKESHLYKKIKNKLFKRYLFAGLCGMVAGAIICGVTIWATLALTGGYNKNYVDLVQHSVTDSGMDIYTGTVKEDGVELDVTQIAEKVGPSVVGIVNKQAYTSMGGIFEQKGGSGSGIIISEDGYIVTNSHVIEGAAGIEVVLNTGEKYSARLIGMDVKTDLAIIKIDASDLPAAELGKSSDLKTGELAVAIGNPLGLEFQGSVTTGVISALNRTMEVEGRRYTLVQTDAAINPGNSGGPLVNKYGKVIGINTVKISADSTEGMGFAIPVDVAVPVIEELIKNGYVTGRPQIGISIRDITETMSLYYNLPVGVYVLSVSPGSGAEKANLQTGDVIIKADDKTVATSDELNDVKDTHKIGDTLKLTIVRGGETMDVNVVLGEEKPAN